MQSMQPSVCKSLQPEQVIVVWRRSRDKKTQNCVREGSARRESTDATQRNRAEPVGENTNELDPQSATREAFLAEHLRHTNRPDPIAVNINIHRSETNATLGGFRFS